MKIMLVDNVKSILDREKSLLNRENFQVFIATSGEEALENHRREKFDAIILDMHMPGMSGEEVCRIIRNDPEMKKVSILMATLADDKDEIERCKLAGANGHIKKPINKDDLTAKLAAVMNVPTRQSIRILVRIKLDGKVGGDFFIANTVDVSATGLLFESERDFTVGDLMETSFFLPGADGFKRVVTLSEVMRTVQGEGNAKRYGVRFTEFREGGQEIIADFVAKKTGKV